MTSRAGGPGPFGALGLEPGRELGDDDIRAAWRRVAAATHPDRADGGDPAVFAAAAAAYAVLRTATGRGEALADLMAPGAPVTASSLGDGRGARRSCGRRLRSIPARIRQGRPAVLAARVLLAATAGTVAVTADGWQPASLAILAGLATWLLCTIQSDLAPPR
jgi:hypothetical protein